jgi:hypothetical protein
MNFSNLFADPLRFRLLNSGLYIGLAEDLLRLWDNLVPAVSDEDDDQLFYAYLFIDEDMRVVTVRLGFAGIEPSGTYPGLSFLQTRYGMALDYRSHLFQNFPNLYQPTQRVPELCDVRFEGTGRAYVRLTRE